jgi:hypothetical protein
LELPKFVLHKDGSTHANEGIESFLNKNNSPMTSAREDSSIEAPTLNMFSSSSNLGPTKSTTTTDVMAIKCSQSKTHCQKKNNLDIIFRCQLDCI